jgi:hypothetical protein
MQRSSHFTRTTSGLVVVLLTAAAVASTTRAQEPMEATTEVPSGPTFGGPLGERSKLTGDWLGWRSILQDHGITFDVSTTQ